MADNVTKIVSIQLNASQAVNGIAQLNSLIQTEKELMKQLTAENKRGTEQYAMAEKTVQELNRTKRQLQREVQAEVKLEREQTGSLNQLRNQLSDLTKQYDNLSRAERENINVGGKLKNQINQVTNEIKAAEEGTQRYYRNVGNYQNAIMSALGLNNQYVQSLMLISSNGAGASSAINAITMSVKSFGKALWALMSNPVFLALAGIAGAGMAFKWFYDYNVEVEKALRLTREFTGVTGSELQNLRAEIQATASTYGKEYKEVLESVDLLMTHFNLTSEQAIRTLNDGFMIGADINGNYLQLLKQYAPTLKDAGINAQQLVAYIQQTRSGIFSQQGLEAIKQASARIREMSKGTRESLQGIGIDVDELQQKLRTNQMEMVDAIKMVSDKLKELPANSQEVGNVMADVFGRQGKFASQEMIKSLGDIETNLESLKEASGDYGKSLDDNQQATADLEKATADFFGVGENGWETLKTQVDTLWKRSLTNTIKKTKDLMSKFAEMGRKSDIFRVVANTISGMVWQLTIGIVDMFRNIGQGFKAIGSWVDAFVNTFKSAFQIIKDLGSGVGLILSGEITKGLAVMGEGLRHGINNTLAGINVALKETNKAIAGTFHAFTTGYEAMDRVWKYGANHLGGGAEGSWGGEDDIEDEDLDKPDKPTNRNKGNRKGGTSKASKSTPKASTTQTAKQERDEELERQKKLYQELQKQAEALEKKALDEQAKISIEGIKAKYKAQEDAIRAAYSDLNKLTEDEQKQANAMMNQLIEQNTKEQAQAIQAFYTKQAEGQAKTQAYWDEQAKQLVQASLEASQEGTDIWLKWRLEQLRMAMEAELEMVAGNSELRNAIIAKYEKQATEIYQENAKAQVEAQTAKYEAMAQVAGGLSQMVGEFADDSREAAVASKVLALGEIMVSQAVAIANAVKAGSNATNPWQMIAQIAASVTAVTVAMIQAFKSLDSAKFATGGYVRGAGTSTSDSIPVRVSNGESIMNANTTAMFGGLLSSLNQLGGGVPIQVTQSASNIKGEDMLARAVARGVAMLPAPVVSVQDINRGQRQVEVLNERALL